MSDRSASDVEQEKQDVRDFAHWIAVARKMVHDSFVGDEAELQRITIQAANSLMLEHKLGRIEHSLDEIKTSLNSDKD